LAKFPGLKEPGAIFELINALSRCLRDPHYYEPVFDTASNTTFKRDEKELRSFKMTTAFVGGEWIEGFRAGRENAVAALEEYGNTSNSELRKSALKQLGPSIPRSGSPRLKSIRFSRPEKRASPRPKD
jgi:hypothetical protein